MQQFVGISLKTRLYLLVLAAFIPVAVLIFYIAEEQKALETEAILQKTTVLARTLASEENQQLESIRNLLSVVAGASMMANGRTQRLSGLFSKLLQQSNGYAEFGVLDPNGRLLAGSSASKSPQDYSRRSWFLECRLNKTLAMGSYQGEHIGDEPVLYFASPALNEQRQIMSVVFAAVKLNWMNRNVFNGLSEMPKGSRMTLLDETQGMLRYNVDSGRWSVPLNFAPELRQEIVRRQSGTLSAADEKQVMRIYAFARIASSFRNRRVSVVLEIPQALALAASNRIFTRNVALLVISALMAVLSIWWAGDVFILRRVRAMVQASRRLATGDLGARIGKIGVRDELSHLAGVFDEMATSLQMRIEREEQVMLSLEQSREQLRKLAAYQQEVREQERIRIAREIHDQLGQSLTILKMDLSWLKKRLSDELPNVDEKMAAMSEVIDEALKNLHAVTAELRPVILDDFGLAAALEWQVEEFRSRSGIECNMQNSGSEPDLPKDQATAVFRIFQECLTNILRHAQAGKAVVRLEEKDGELILEVRDDGRGITADEINNPTSYGLLGMRERLYPWNGSITIEGRAGQGTCVTIRLPLSTKGGPL